MSCHTLSRRARAGLPRLLAVLVCVVAPPSLVPAPAAAGNTATPPASATLERCATAIAPQTERSATFVGEMTTIPGTAHMQLRIDLQEKPAGATRYRTVDAPGLGVWHSSSPGVKSFTHIQQVTDLSAPAVYRALVSFRWLGAKGQVLKSETLHTETCDQPTPTSAPGARGGTAG